MLEIKQVYKQFKGQKSFALHDVSFTIRKGEVYGILGPNGAGKTTLFSILSGVYQPNSGSVFFQGKDLIQNFQTFKYNIGVVPQDIALYPTLSAVQNLKFMGRMYGLKGRELDRKVHEMLDYFSFEENRYRAIKSYSGGMKRKINLIAGILHDPDLLLLDEPTAGMDVQSRNKIMDELKRLNEVRDLSILYTSHYLEQAEKFCDRISILHEGKIMTTGQPISIVQENKVDNLETVFISLTQNPST